jgi:hypothetical protein
MRGVPKRVCRGCGRWRQKGEQGWMQGGLSIAESARATEKYRAFVAANPWTCPNCLDVAWGQLRDTLTGLQPRTNG